MSTSTDLSIGYLIPTREAIMSDQPETGPLLELADRADRLGYASAWVGDSLVARPRHEPLTMLTAIAARTESMIVGTAVLIPVLRHPVVMAHQVATLDRIAEGRLVLGVGISANTPAAHAEFETAGITFERRVGRFNDHLALCRKLWSGEPVTHDGPFYSVENATIGPSAHSPGGPPLWIAGSTPPSLKRAAARYDGWMPIDPVDTYEASWATLQDEARAAGRNPGDISPSAYLTVSLDEDAEVADQTLTDFLGTYYSPAPPAVMRKMQACYAGPRNGLTAWVAEFVKSGAQHLILRFAGAHEDHLEQCSNLKSDVLSHLETVA
ncbi:MAG: alkanesulfonate monooxygenase SsuD [Candidatus Poriferisodalaceae bacterium]|jgi:alkanesulfonate monooxygenase SsuD/methylene tetrahydromethanopterin reductase-like flavin-dependent oxidoreductase (luciferase family)